MEQYLDNIPANLKIDFLGFGEAARAFHHSMRPLVPQAQFRAYDRLLDTGGDMRDAMGSRDVLPITQDQMGASDWIISAVTADQSLAAALDVVPHLTDGQIYFDVNSVSPKRKQETAALVTGQGAQYVDLAIMAPVFPLGHQTPVLIAGVSATQLEPMLKAMSFDLRIIGPDVGQATAIKMVRSLFVKGIEAVTVECLLAAEASGCYPEIFASLSKSYPGLGWPEFANYEFERTLRHGTRRAAEMRESAATIRDLGLLGHLADAIADVQGAMGQTDVSPDAPIADILRQRRNSSS